MPLKPHPTDPDKMVYVNAEYNLPKPWVGLTDDEYNKIWRQDLTNKDLMDLTIAKLKEKNT